MRLLLTVVLTIVVVPLVAEDPSPAQRIPVLLRQLSNSGRVLYITAHPDDEDAGLVARLSHVDGADVALMTLTRGEGGQNEIGDELFAALGVLRSRELEAAHRIDGARQYYSHALDFGYSFSVEETFERWGRERILQDIVAVIREFRPDVILTMKPDGGGGGQHHQASALLAQEAFVVAADGTRWPQLGAAHQTQRLFRQVGPTEAEVADLCAIDLGVTDALLGVSPFEMGVRSRAQHKCQGMVFLHEPFARRVSRWQQLLPLEETAPLSHILEGLGAPFSADETWRKRVARAREAYDPENTDALLPALWALWKDLDTRPAGAARDGFRDDLREALQLTLNVRVSARVSSPLHGPGSDILVRCVVVNDGPNDLHIQFRTDARWGLELAESDEIQVGAGAREEFELELRTSNAFTLPRAVPQDSSRVDRDRYLRPNWVNFTCVPWVRTSESSSTPVELPAVPIQTRWVDPEFPQFRTADLQVVPDPSIRFRESVSVAPASEGGSGNARVEVLVTSRVGGKIEVALETTEPGWRVTPESFTVESRPGEDIATSVLVSSPEGVSGETLVRARARRSFGVERPWSDSGYQQIDHRHVGLDGLLVAAETRVVSFVVATERRRIAYVEGTGDRVRDAIERLGLAVEVLTPEDLASGQVAERLRAFDVIVSGVRAFKVRDDLKSAWAEMQAWMNAGGTFVCQYNKFEFNDGSDESPWAPYPGALVTRDRVTDETALIRVRSPEHPLFKIPNQLTRADWDGWVQERGLYFLGVTGAPYQDLITCEDPFPFNAGAKSGALVHAQVGKGHWVYVGLGLFRQLPAGVPGAYRLLANLLAL